MLPSVRRVTALANATDPFSKPFLEQVQLAGEARRARYRRRGDRMK